MSAHSSSIFTKWFKRVAIILIFLELVYLVLFNILLNTSYVQKKAEKIGAGKLQFQWENAWTPYPMRVNIEKLAISGQSGSRAWMAQAESASLSISPISLMSKTIDVCNIGLDNITYTEGAANSADLAQPDRAEERNETAVSLAEEGLKEKGSRRYVNLNGIAIHGHHRIETEQFSAEMDGNLDMDLALSGREERLAVKNAKVDIVVNSLQDNKGKEILRDGKIKSVFKLSSLDYKKEKRGALLKHLSLDGAISAEMESLDVFDTHLQKNRNIHLSGKGALNTQIHLKDGQILPESKLKIEAGKLSVGRDEYLARGEGKIILLVTEKDPDTLESKIVFGNFHAYTNEGKNIAQGGAKKEIPLFEGNGLTLYSRASSTLYPKPSSGLMPAYLGLVLPPVAVNDLSTIQKIIPEKWGVRFYSGRGKLEVRADIDERGLGAVLNLLSKDAEIGFDGQHLRSDMDMSVRMKIATAPRLQADFAGTYIALGNTKLSSQEESGKRESKPWNTRLEIKNGVVNFALSDIKDAEALTSILKKHKAKDILAKAEGNLKLKGDISRLEWINLLMKSSAGLSVSGSGLIDADLRIRNGSVANGSRMSIKSENLEVALLDYIYRGEGVFLAEKGDNKGSSAMKYALDLEKATMKRRDEKEANISGVVMRLERAGSKEAEADRSLHLKISSAKVERLSQYNHYLPESSPFVIEEGSADLTADIILDQNDTRGSVRMLTDGMVMRVNNQSISARLNLDTNIVSGDAREMKFDISGSRIILDQAGVFGEKRDYSDNGWSMNIDMQKADIVWKKPIYLNSRLLLRMKDSRPIIALISNANSKFEIVSKMLIVDDLKGEADLSMRNNTITIPYAMVKSSKIDIGAKGIISKDLHEGVIFLKHKNFKGLLKMERGKNSFDIFNAQKSFDSYTVPSPLSAKRE